jgi:hypothetical protein
MPHPLARRRRSDSHAKNDVHDAFDFTEKLRVEVEGDFDVFVVLPGDLEGEARGCELNEPQAVVAGVGIVIEGLDVADAAIIILELTLNEKIGLIGGRQIQVIVAGVLVIERDLEVFAAGLSDGHMFGTESHWRWPCFSDLLRPHRDPNCQKGRLKATASRSASPMPALPSGRHWSGSTPSPPCHYVPAGVTPATSFGSSLLPVRLTSRDIGRRSEIMSAFRGLRSSERDHGALGRSLMTRNGPRAALVLGAESRFLS